MLKRLLTGLLGLLLLCGITLWGWYQVDGIPTPESAMYLNGEGYESRRDSDGNLFFLPDKPNGRGVVIMHGALIKPQSYARSAAFFARNGYTVVLPYGPGRMSIAAVDNVPKLMQQVDADEWYFIGHSMGGMASLEAIRTHRLPVRAVALWATAMPTDFSDLDIPMMFIWGTRDELLPEKRFRLGRENLPDDVEYITLDGANHKNFAMYSHQFFDGDATLGWMEQIDFANRTTAAFFARHQAGPRSG